jgi:hypothetical protein
MAVKLYRPGSMQALAFIEAGGLTWDRHAEWHEHRPFAPDQVRYAARYGLAALGKWHRAVGDAEDPRRSRPPAPGGSSGRPGASPPGQHQAPVAGPFDPRSERHADAVDPVGEPARIAGCRPV